MKATEEVYHIYFEKDLEAVVMEWNGYSTSVQFREGTELMLRTLVENKCAKVLADIRNMTLIGMEDQHWLETDFLPRAIASGFRAIAIITPVAYFNKVAVETISYKVDKAKLVISYFDNRKSAEEWIGDFGS
ncbi:MAG TPA: hypothetical protein VK826_02730 [Bacteroidia bacterium]|nr:hypothetical protein [Bacteroidia bacterium]